MYTTACCKVTFNQVWRMAKEDQKSAPGSKVDIYTCWSNPDMRSNTGLSLRPSLPDIKHYNYTVSYLLKFWTMSQVLIKLYLCVGSLIPYILCSYTSAVYKICLVLNMSVFCFLSEVFSLFRLHDYDHSGLLDGLEMMKLLSDYNSYHTPGTQTNELVRRSGCLLYIPNTFILFVLFIWPQVCVVFWLQVVSMVDFLLQSQDLNQDGLLAPSELLSPALPHTQVLYIYTPV